MRLIDQPVRADGSGRRVLLVAPASSYRIAAYLNAARKLGLQPWVVSQGEHSLVHAVAGGIQVPLADPTEAVQRVRAACADAPPVAVVATDDATVALAAAIAADLHLPHNAVEAARLSQRKDLARRRLSEYGLPVPRFHLLDLSQPLRAQLTTIDFPCVVKPLALSGSRGVIRADDRAQLESACARTAAIAAREFGAESELAHTVLVEQFIPGPEIAVEGIVDRGRVRILAMFDKPDPLDGPFFEETYYVSPARLEARLAGIVSRRLQQACEAYGLCQGPVHAEFRLWQGEAWLLELAARTIGGQCARMLEFGAGHTLEEVVLAQAAGVALSYSEMPGAVGVLMLPTPARGVLRRVEGVLEAARVPGVEDVEISVREGYELVPLPEGSSYLGFVFARASTPEQVEAALRAAHRCLRIVTAPVLPVTA